MISNFVKQDVNLKATGFADLNRQTKHMRQISYASSAHTKAGRALICFMEHAGGRGSLLRRSRGYEARIADGLSFWRVMIECYGIDLDVVNGSIDKIPKNGPVIVTANHPYGILDGLTMGYLLSETRGDFRIFANDVFSQYDDLSGTILPLSFKDTKNALQINLKTRKNALKFLDRGGAIGIFPGGTVSTAITPFNHTKDPRWPSFTAKMIAKSESVVVPIYFYGHTSRLFQLASHMHATLRMGLLIKEFARRVDTSLKISIGDPLGRDEMTNYLHEPSKLMDFLRQKTYELSKEPVDANSYGYEFEERYRA